VVEQGVGALLGNVVPAVGKHDAVEPFGHREQHACGGLFLDTSRGGRRRWCSMATCGNKVKKATLKSHRAARDGAALSQP
jgi:hypothetical protein